MDYRPKGGGTILICHTHPDRWEESIDTDTSYRASLLRTLVEGNGNQSPINLSAGEISLTGQTAEEFQDSTDELFPDSGNENGMIIQSRQFDRVTWT